MKPIFCILILVSYCFGVSAEIKLQAGDEEKPPAVTVALECAEKDRFRFRIHNRTPWVISVPTYRN